MIAWLWEAAGPGTPGLRGACGEMLMAQRAAARHLRHRDACAMVEAAKVTGIHPETGGRLYLPYGTRYCGQLYGRTVQWTKMPRPT